MAGDHGKRRTMRAHDSQAFSDSINPLSLGTMSASAYIENSAKNSTCLICYEELISSLKWCSLINCN